MTIPPEIKIFPWAEIKIIFVHSKPPLSSIKDMRLYYFLSSLRFFVELITYLFNHRFVVIKIIGIILIILGLILALRIIGWLVGWLIFEIHWAIRYKTYKRIKPFWLRRGERIQRKNSRRD